MAPAVPETVLRKRKRDEQWAAKKAAAAAEVCFGVSWMISCRESVDYNQNSTVLCSTGCHFLERAWNWSIRALAAKHFLMPSSCWSMYTLEW